MFGSRSDGILPTTAVQKYLRVPITRRLSSRLGYPGTYTNESDFPRHSTSSQLQHTCSGLLMDNAQLNEICVCIDDFLAHRRHVEASTPGNKLSTHLHMASRCRIMPETAENSWWKQFAGRETMSRVMYCVPIPRCIADKQATATAAIDQAIRYQCNARALDTYKHMLEAVYSNDSLLSALCAEAAANSSRAVPAMAMNASGTPYEVPRQLQPQSSTAPQISVACWTRALVAAVRKVLAELQNHLESDTNARAFRDMPRSHGAAHGLSVPLTMRSDGSAEQRSHPHRRQPSNAKPNTPTRSSTPSHAQRLLRREPGAGMRRVPSSGQREQRRVVRRLTGDECVNGLTRTLSESSAGTASDSALQRQRRNSSDSTHSADDTAPSGASACNGHSSGAIPPSLPSAAPAVTQAGRKRGLNDAPIPRSVKPVSVPASPSHTHTLTRKHAALFLTHLGRYSFALRLCLWNAINQRCDANSIVALIEECAHICVVRCECMSAAMVTLSVLLENAFILHTTAYRSCTLLSTILSILRVVYGVLKFGVGGAQGAISPVHRRAQQLYDACMALARLLLTNFPWEVSCAFPFAFVHPPTSSSCVLLHSPVFGLSYSERMSASGSSTLQLPQSELNELLQRTQQCWEAASGRYVLTPVGILLSLEDCLQNRLDNKPWAPFEVTQLLCSTFLNASAAVLDNGPREPMEAAGEPPLYHTQPQVCCDHICAALSTVLQWCVQGSHRHTRTHITSELLRALHVWMVKHRFVLGLQPLMHAAMKYWAQLEARDMPVLANIVFQLIQHRVMDLQRLFDWMFACETLGHTEAVQRQSPNGIVSANARIKWYAAELVFKCVIERDMSEQLQLRAPFAQYLKSAFRGMEEVRVESPQARAPDHEISWNDLSSMAASLSFHSLREAVAVVRACSEGMLKHVLTCDEVYRALLTAARAAPSADAQQLVDCLIAFAHTPHNQPLSNDSRSVLAYDHAAFSRCYGLGLLLSRYSCVTVHTVCAAVVRVCTQPSHVPLDERDAVSGKAMLTSPLLTALSPQAPVVCAALGLLQAYVVAGGEGMDASGVEDLHTAVQQLLEADSPTAQACGVLLATTALASGLRAHTPLAQSQRVRLAVTVLHFIAVSAQKWCSEASAAAAEQSSPLRRVAQACVSAVAAVVHSLRPLLQTDSRWAALRSHVQQLCQKGTAEGDRCATTRLWFATALRRLTHTTPVLNHCTLHINGVNGLQNKHSENTNGPTAYVYAPFAAFTSKELFGVKL